MLLEHGFVSVNGAYFCVVGPTAPVASSMILRYPLQVVSIADQANIVKHINNTGIAVAAFVTITHYVHRSGAYAMLLTWL